MYGAFSDDVPRLAAVNIFTAPLQGDVSDHSAWALGHLLEPSGRHEVVRYDLVESGRECSDFDSPGYAF